MDRTAMSPTTTQADARETARRLRAIHAAARPCGSTEDGRAVLAIHADAARLTDLTHAADHIEALAALVVDQEQASVGLPPQVQPETFKKS